MRLIDVDKLSKPVYAEDDNITGIGMTSSEVDGYNDGIDEAWKQIVNAQTVDAVPVVHGRRVYHDDGVITCSECGNAESSDSYYCRYCGAKMDGEP